MSNEQAWEGFKDTPLDGTEVKKIRRIIQLRDDQDAIIRTGGRFTIIIKWFMWAISALVVMQMGLIDFLQGLLIT